MKTSIDAYSAILKHCSKSKSNQYIGARHCPRASVDKRHNKYVFCANMEHPQLMRAWTQR